MLKNKIVLLFCVWFMVQGFPGPRMSLAATSTDYVAIPPFVSSGAPPLVMLVMGRDHKLYYEAYNDASDLNEDGVIDIRYTPSIDYYGYFDSYKCYEYSTADERFNPFSKTTDKTCDGTKWSGDFLNYLTMSRMDTIRKVLYGGYRSSDTTTRTVLQRVYVPQDAHSWGKEYTSIAVDGYDIAKYTPFTQPSSGLNLRHLFASTTLSDNGTPILRYALNNQHRIWDWVAKERPVVDDSIETAGSGYPGHPNNHDEFEDRVDNYATTGNLMGTGGWSDWTKRNQLSQRYPSPNATTFGAIDGEGNPYKPGYGYPADTDPRDSGAVDQNNYLAIFTGTLNVTTGGSYQFGVDGDDAVEVIIDGNVPGHEAIVGYYGGHSANGAPGGVPTNTITIPSLSAGTHTIEFRMEEANGDDRYYLYWKGPDSGAGEPWQIIPNTKISNLILSTYKLEMPGSTITDLVVRVKVCDPNKGLEANCKQYPDGQYKPIGLLQRHGESKRMYFGLMTGSYAKNTSGGVLRKRVGDISDEIVTNTGQFNTAVNGIIQTLNKLRIYGFGYGDHAYNCGWISDRPMKEGECRDWGNPIAEMMYETLRYFAGEDAPTGAFDYTVGSTNDDDSKLYSPILPAPYNQVGLPKASWNDPYDKNNGGFDSCSKPFMLVLSDINPSYDSDQLPGAYSGFPATPAFTDTFGTFNAENLANEISAEESGITGNKYIGQSKTNSDSICSPKTVAGFGDIRGLCPEEPTKMGGYYSASVAYYGHITDLRPDINLDQNVTTYSVGLASPLPRIELFLGPDKKQITLVPFGKTVASEGDTTPKTFTPTNGIVEFFVDTWTKTYGKFRISYEDVEQGADHDMDAIVLYEYQLIDADGNSVTDPVNATQVKISLTSEYAAGSFIQHMGYIISGTTADGTYLEVRDIDTSEDEDVVYPFDTLPAGSPAGTKLPLFATRTFSPAATTDASPAKLLENPLWYAAKWGAFDDENGNGDGLPNGTDGDEWDKDKDGVPDTYFYVTNPLRLEEQLNKSFGSILNHASSGTAASVISNTRSGEGAVYQSIFYPTRTDGTASANTVTWVGQVHSFLVDAYGNMREDSFANKKLDVKGPDLNGDGRVYNEDINMNCQLDVQTTDTDGNGVLDTEDTNHNGVLDTESSGACVPGDDTFLSQLDAIIEYQGTQAQRFYDVNGDGILEDRERIWNVAPAVDKDHPISYLWNSSDWLNSITDADIVSQRSSYLSTSKQRYIFTWVDGNHDEVVNESTEIMDFAWPTTPPILADLVDGTKFYPYLNLYSSFSDKPAAISALSTTNFQTFLLAETEREIEYQRGLDDVDANGRPVPLSIGGSDIAGTELRSRKFEGKTWRLGDIVYSTPTAVGRPSEGYHLLYRDDSYADFAAQYEKRRIVVYTGANDGMLHAFNGGFYDGFHKQFCREITADYNPYDAVHTNDVGCVDDAITTQPELGAELWAYIPYNLLPHLHWLTETEYEHSYYVDQKPRIFDAKIFPPDDVGGLHPHGWGTVMVVGMRLGGASIVADIDKTATTDDATDPTMKSAFLIFDVTDPEIKPKLLGEVSMPQMGFSTSYPAVVVMKDGNHDKSFGDYSNTNPASGENRWFLAFGSGPANASGDPESYVLSTAASSQSAKFYMLDLVKLASNNELWTLTDANPSGITEHGVLTSGLHWYSALDTNSFVSDPITVDYNLDYNTDVLYYGTVSTDGSSWGGKLRRIVIDDVKDGDEDQDPTNWVPNSVLFDAQQPITAAATAGLDDDGRNWIFFGTGRYFVTLDGTDDNQQSYYGIKEPIFSATDPYKTWNEVSKDDLVDVTNYKVLADGSQIVDTDGDESTTETWSDLVAEQAVKSGWYINFVGDETNATSLIGERNLGQAVLLGGALTFTTFIPSDDVCVAGGESHLWAAFYKTGTGFPDAILGSVRATFNDVDSSLSRRKISLGQGLATSPNLHVGSEEGSKAFVQTSTGAIDVITQQNPFNVKSGMRSWKESE